MTMNFLIAEFEEPCFFKIDAPGVSNKKNWSLDHVTNGTCAIRDNKDYLSLERYHFQSILDAYDSPERNRKPFWVGNVAPSGLAAMSEHKIEAYAFENKPYIKLIDSSWKSPWNLEGIPHYHAQVIIGIETIREMAKAVANRYK